MPSITIHKLPQALLQELVDSDELTTAVQEGDPRLTRFESQSNVGDSLTIYSGVFMDLEPTVEECEFSGSEGLATFLTYFGEEDFRNDFELDEDVGFVGSYSPESLATIREAATQIDWSAFQATAEEEGECEVPVEVLVNYTKDLVQFLEAAAKEAGAVVVVYIS